MNIIFVGKRLGIPKMYSINFIYGCSFTVELIKLLHFFQVLQCGTYCLNQALCDFYYTGGFF